MAHVWGFNVRRTVTCVRLGWEYIPGRELFVVCTDGRNLEPLPGASGLMNRSFAVKVTRLLRFQRAVTVEEAGRPPRGLSAGAAAACG